MLHINYKPSISLLPFIDRYWYFDSDTENGIDLFPLFPGTGVDLFIHFSSPFQTEKERLASSHIFCPRQTFAIASKEKLAFVAVRFRSGAFRHFCALNFSELNDRFLSVQDIWGKEGLELTDKLKEESAVTLRINILDTFFLKQLKKFGKKNRELDLSISYIYQHFEDVEIHTLAKKQNISLRHFERLFKNEFGISPKKFQIIIRFRATLKELLLSSHSDYFEIAVNNGYYDQSHFIKECKALSDISPLQLIKMRDKRYHFYFRKYMDYPDLLRGCLNFPRIKK